MSKLDDRLADEFISRQLDLLRLEASIRKDVLRELEKLNSSLVKKLSGKPLTEFSKGRITQLIREATKTIDAHYARTENSVTSQINQLSALEVRASAQALETVIVDMDAHLPTKTFTKRLVDNALVEGAPSSEWWAKQSQDTAFRFSNAIRQGVLAGETNQQIVGRISGTRTQAGVMEVSKKNAQALVRTSIQSVANEARLETFKQNEDVIAGLQQLSTLDGRTSDICIAYAGGVWDLEGNPIRGTRLPFKGGPPRHWNCRSVLVPVTKTFAEMGVDLPEPPPAQAASADGPVAAGSSFADFLDRKGPAFQDRVLGKGRAELWRKGDITLQQLLDLRGNPLTLEQLKARTA